MLADDGSEIMEGFICPFCMTDQKKYEKLLEHFDEQHSDDKDLISQFRDVFKSAKKKILNETELTKSFESTLKTSKSLLSNTLPENDFYMPEYQEIGETRNHVEFFKAIRNPRLERFATETNKLIIRLNKLVTDRPKDPQQIKLHEQSVSEESIDLGIIDKLSIISESSMDRWKAGETLSIVCQEFFPHKTPASLSSMRVGYVQRLLLLPVHRRFQ